MTDIILRLQAGKVSAVDADQVGANRSEPLTDVVLTFDELGAFVTAQLVLRNLELVKRNEEQTSDGS